MYNGTDDRAVAHSCRFICCGLRDGRKKKVWWADGGALHPVESAFGPLIFNGVRRDRSTCSAVECGMDDEMAYFCQQDGPEPNDGKGGRGKPCCSSRTKKSNLIGEGMGCPAVAFNRQTRRSQFTQVNDGDHRYYKFRGILIKPPGARRVECSLLTCASPWGKNGCGSRIES